MSLLLNISIILIAITAIHLPRSTPTKEFYLPAPSRVSSNVDRSWIAVRRVEVRWSSVRGWLLVARELIGWLEHAKGYAIGTNIHFDRWRPQPRHQTYPYTGSRRCSIDVLADRLSLVDNTQHAPALEFSATQTSVAEVAVGFRCFRDITDSLWGDCLM